MDSPTDSNRISHLKARIKGLQQELQVAEQELARVSAKSIVDNQTAAQDANPKTLTADQKVAIFQSLFVGRSDVYARRWENINTGKSGYAPACGNEWEPVICQKPRIKCSECLHQNFLKLDAIAVKSHLQGKQVVGVYPLDKTQRTTFLAADFDGPNWKQDCASVIKVLRARQLPFALERSRSGNGAHLWLLFKEAVLALHARRLGFLILSQAMELDHRLPLASFDRLFPNQDILPDAGFGNLIALPLQGRARENDNSVFLDDQFEPLPDQWEFLQKIERISAATINQLGAKAPGDGFKTEADSDDDLPWNRLPSGKSALPPLKELPLEIAVVRAQAIFIPISALPNALIIRLKRLAIFSNPEFHKRQNMRLSVKGIPRFLSLFEDDGSYLTLPRGCTDAMETMAMELGFRWVWDDKTVAGNPVALNFTGTLRPEQVIAVTSLKNCNLGILCAPPGSGKTVMAAALLAHWGRNTLILVHRQPLLEQWVDRLSTFLEIPAIEIGSIGGGKNRATGRIDVAMIQSLVRGDQVVDRIAEYGVVVVDECHHVPAVSIERVLREVRSQKVIGLTATPRRKDGLHPILYLQCGPIRHTLHLDKSDAAIKRVLVIHETGIQPPESAGLAGIQVQFAYLAANTERTQRIINDVVTAVAEGRTPIVLTERVEHLEILEQGLKTLIPNVVTLRGGRTVKQRRQDMANLSAIPEEQNWVLLATGRYLGEGFDEPRLDTLFLAMPISWKGTLEQYAGRLARVHAGKDCITIVDYVDDGPLLKSMARKRALAWKSLGYKPIANSDP